VKTGVVDPVYTELLGAWVYSLVSIPP